MAHHMIMNVLSEDSDAAEFVFLCTMIDSKLLAEIVNPAPDI